MRAGVAGQVDGVGAEGVAAAVAQPRQGARLDRGAARHRVDGVGVGGGSSTICSSPSACRRPCPAGGPTATSRPSRPAPRGRAWAPPAPSAWVREAPCRKPCRARRRAPRRALDLDVSRRWCSECQSPLTSSHTSSRTPRVISSARAAERAGEQRGVLGRGAVEAVVELLGPVWRAMAKPVARRLGGAEFTRSPLFSTASMRGRLRTCCSSLSAVASGSRSSTVKRFSSPRRSMPRRPVRRGGLRGEGPADDLARGARLRVDRVREAGHHQVGLDPHQAGEQRHVVDPQVDHQPEPAQQRRQVAEHAGALVEVGLGLAHGRRDRAGHRALAVRPLLLGRAGSSAGRGAGRRRAGAAAAPSSTSRRGPGSRSLARASSRLVTRRSRRTSRSSELGDRQPVPDVDAQGVQQRPGQGVAVDAGRLHRRGVHRQRVDEEGVLLHAVGRERAPGHRRVVGRRQGRTASSGGKTRGQRSGSSSSRSGVTGMATIAPLLFRPRSVTCAPRQPRRPVADVREVRRARPRRRPA